VVNWKLIRRQGSRNTRNGQRYLSYMSIKSLLEDVIFWWLCIRMESWRRCSKRRRCWFLLTEKVQSRATSCISVQQGLESYIQSGCIVWCRPFIACSKHFQSLSWRSAIPLKRGHIRASLRLVVVLSSQPWCHVPLLKIIPCVSPAPIQVILTSRLHP